MTNLKVNELYGPVKQGEGPAVDESCFFLRLAGCNLKCTWCDSKYTHDWSLYDRTVEEHSMTAYEIRDKLIEMAMKTHVRLVVVSGGEPLMQSLALYDLMTLTTELDFDVETAGTLYPGDRVMSRFRNVVVSPKLLSSGNNGRRAIRLKELREFARWPNVSFKFVVGDEEDVEEIMNLLPLLPRRPWENIYLMPLGATKEELAKSSPQVEQLAKSLNMSYSPRRHIELYGTRRGI